MPWFTFQRSEGYPTHYPDHHSAATVDILTAGLILAFVILGFSLLVVIPSFHGAKKVIFFFKFLISLIIGGIVVVGNFGQEWETGRVRITSPYKAASSVEIKADLGIHIGLRGVNVTLNNADKKYSHPEGALDHEDIRYNEYFSNQGVQGRFGFGFYADQVSRDFREGLYKGLPLPILQLVEYFTFDGEGIRFGRHYRIAGWYAQIFMWTAFPCWIIACVFIFYVVHYGALFLLATGTFQLLALGIWYFNRNFVELQVPYEYERKEVILRTHFGSDYYLILFNSLFCITLSLAIFVLNAFFPDQMCQFFGIDPLTIYDEFHLTKAEIVAAKKEDKLDESITEKGPDDSAVFLRRKSNENQLVLKKKSDVASRLLQKSFRKRALELKSYPTKRSPATVEENEMSTILPLLQKSRQYGSSDR